LDLPDALRLVPARGRRLDELPQAAVNSPDRCIVIGPAAAVEQLRERLTAMGEQPAP
jgi:acyl transferase domain-containing protein